MSTTRRSILSTGIKSVATLGVASLFKGTAFAAPRRGSGQAIVSINLIGGNDSNNMIVPVDSAGYTAYSRGRRELAIPQASLLPVSAASQRSSFGLHPNLGELREVYNQGTLAFLANVGSMQAPLTKAIAQGRATALPNDMGAHTADSRWYFVKPGFALPVWTQAFQQPVTEDDPVEVFGFSSGLMVIPSERTRIEGAVIDNGKLMLAMAKAAPLRTQFPATGLGLQLRQVAQLLQAGPSLGLELPVFSTSLAGFDTHIDQMARQALLFTTLSQAMAAFYEATSELGVSHRVTTYTDTEFNRTLAPNATHGSEHGWGGHQIVMGGSVRGGDIIGSMPSLELGGADDFGTSGVWVPTIATSQMHATIAERYGVHSSDSAKFLPGLQNFASARLPV